LNIPSPAGSLEALYEPGFDGGSASATAAGGVCAVLCHPHPLYGGNMHDGVLDCVANVLRRAGVGCLRFNFRGVGASSGAHDGGAGEVDDLLAAIAWLRTNDRATDRANDRANQNVDRLWLGGYSFGAYVAWQSLARGASPERVLLVAPPVGRMPFTEQSPGCRVDVFAGDQDEFVDQAALTAWQGVHTHVIAGADHFFSSPPGAWEALGREVARAIA
jgi:alpha/beta superfamily hydrolase